MQGRDCRSYSKLRIGDRFRQRWHLKRIKLFRCRFARERIVAVVDTHSVGHTQGYLVPVRSTTTEYCGDTLPTVLVVDAMIALVWFVSIYTVPVTRCRVLLYLMDSTSRATVSVSLLVVLLIMNCSMQMMLVGQQFQPSIKVLKEGPNKWREGKRFFY
jgi:hypothetical protein